MIDTLLLQFGQWWQQVVAFFYFDPTRLHEPDMIARIVLQMLLLFGSAFFSSSETALFSLSRLDLQNLRKRRNPRSETLHALLDQPRRLIISILCGNELVNIAASANMAGILVTLYGAGERAGWINIIVMVPLLLLFGEVTPKTIAVSMPVRYSTFISGPLSLWVRIIGPLRWAIRGVADRITTMIVGAEKAAENILQVDEFRSLVEDVTDEGILDATERVLIYNLLEAGDTEIVEIMTPRTRVDFLSVDMSVREMVEQFKRYQRPRVPVFKGDKDTLVGFVHAEDVLRLILDHTDLDLLKPEDILHPPVMVPLTKRVDEMFEFFQQRNARAAVVLDEFGGVEGFVTMKDVLTFIFGEISGDVEGEELYQEKDENQYVVPGDMKLTDFNNLTNFGIEDPRMTTIGGVAFRHLDDMPREGDKVMVEDIEITVLEMEGHRIAEVRVQKKSASGDLEDEQKGASSKGAKGGKKGKGKGGKKKKDGAKHKKKQAKQVVQPEVGSEAQAEDRTVAAAAGSEGTPDQVPGPETKTSADRGGDKGDKAAKGEGETQKPPLQGPAPAPAPENGKAQPGDTGADGGTTAEPRPAEVPAKPKQAKKEQAQQADQQAKETAAAAASAPGKPAKTAPVAKKDAADKATAKPSPQPEKQGRPGLAAEAPVEPDQAERPPVHAGAKQRGDTKGQQPKAAPRKPGKDTVRMEQAQKTSKPSADSAPAKALPKPKPKGSKPSKPDKPSVDVAPSQGDAPKPKNPKREAATAVEE